MPDLPAPGWFAVELSSEPAVLHAQDEYLRARMAWDSVAPSDGQLPEEPSPLQALLYARMTTSKFAFEMTKRRNGETSVPRPRQRSVAGKTL